MILAAGTTSQSIVIEYVGDNGLPVTGLTYSTMPTTYYAIAGAALVAITLSALGSATAAYSSGGVYELGDGRYRLDLPNAALASQASSVQIVGEASGTHLLAEAIQVQVPATAITATQLNVLPISGNVNISFIATQALPSIPQASAPAIAWACFLSDGTTPLNLSGHEIGLIAAPNPPAAQTPAFQLTTSANPSQISVGGANNNTVNVQLNPTNTAACFQGHYALWDLTANLELFTGSCNVIAAIKPTP